MLFVLRTMSLAFRENVEEWGYIWAHRLLEDAFIRPNFDIEAILNSILNACPDNLDAIANEGQVILPYSSKSRQKLKKLEELQNKLHIQKKELLSKPHDETLAKMLIVTRKVLWHVHIIGMGITTMEMMLEGEKHDQLLKHMEEKVNQTKKELNNKIFEMRLTDLKTKFLVVKNIFELVILSNNDFCSDSINEEDANLRKSRLDSAFVMCEEIFLMISEPHSELYKASHY